MITLHAAILFLSYAAFFVALISGIAFLKQEQRLKHKDPKLVGARILPLEAWDRINWTSVVAGFILYSIGMVQSLGLAHKEWGAFFNADPVELCALGTWVSYAAVLVLRLKVGLKGRRVIFLSVMSFGLVLFTLFALSYMSGTRHTLF